MLAIAQLMMVAGARRAIAVLQTTGPRVAPATSLALNDTPADAPDVIAADNGEAWRLRMPRLPVAINGDNDLDCCAVLLSLAEAPLGRRRARRGRVVRLWRRRHDRGGGCARTQASGSAGRTRPPNAALPAGGNLGVKVWRLVPAPEGQDSGRCGRPPPGAGRPELPPS